MIGIGGYGFYRNGFTYAVYENKEGQPDKLGNRIVKVLKETSLERLRQTFLKIYLIEDTRSESNWKHILKVTGFDLKNKMPSITKLFLKAVDDLYIYKTPEMYWMKNGAKVRDGVFMESAVWVYIINLDTKKLEIYNGLGKMAFIRPDWFTTKPNGRYYSSERHYQGYHPVSYIGEFALNELNKWNAKKITSMAYED